MEEYEFTVSNRTVVAVAETATGDLITTDHNGAIRANEKTIKLDA